MDQLNAEAIKGAAQTQLIGQEIDVQGEVDSTNAALLRRTRVGALEGTVVIAESQTAGQGRLGKPWFSPPGVNLYLSVLLKPPFHIHEAHVLTLMGSLAVADALEAQGVTAQVKWPNDVLVAGKKIAGVLSEVEAAEGHIGHLILGIGVNLNLERHTIDSLLGTEAARATSLQEVLGHGVDRNAFAGLLLEKLEAHYFAFQAKGRLPLLSEWRKRSFLGSRVSVRVEGIAKDIDDEGCLLVTLDDGSTMRIREGEVLPLPRTDSQK